MGDLAKLNQGALLARFIQLRTPENSKALAERMDQIALLREFLRGAEHGLTYVKLVTGAETAVDDPIARMIAC
jgi:hypothetical protein